MFDTWIHDEHSAANRRHSNEGYDNSVRPIPTYPYLLCEDSIARSVSVARTDTTPRLLTSICPDPPLDWWKLANRQLMLGSAD